jgi:PPM family protein phosphatase
LEIPEYNITIGNATDVGRMREDNEDYMAHFHTVLGYCVVVCDGMGGHTSGEIASQNAVEAIKHFLQDGEMTKHDTDDTLRSALEFANYKLHEMGKEDPALKGMGTTCVLALFSNTEMFVAHVGDSRLYLIRNKEIVQVTKDHSVVQSLIDKGVLTVEEAELSDKRNQITKAIGVFEKVNATVTRNGIPLMHNDKILLCSDGLTEHVNKNSICEIITDTDDVQLAAMQLIEKANNRGGSDNITVQIIYYTGPSSTGKKKSAKKKGLIFFGLIALAVALMSIFIYWKVAPSVMDKRASADTTQFNNSLNNGNDTAIKKGNDPSLMRKDGNSLKTTINPDK